MTKIEELTSKNDVCADCDSDKLEWASLTQGIFICVKCSGIHRNMGVKVSKVRSLTMDDWSDEMIECMSSNKESNKIYEYHVIKDYIKPNKYSDSDLRGKYIRAKYRDKIFTKDNNSDKPILEPVYDTASAKDEEKVKGEEIGDTKGMIIITDVKGIDLPKMDALSDTDAYFTVKIQGTEKVIQKSQVVDNDNNPSWKNTVQIMVPGKNIKLVVTLYDEDVGKDDLIGTVVIDGSKLGEKETEFNEEIVGKHKKGTLCFKAIYASFSN